MDKVRNDSTHAIWLSREVESVKSWDYVDDFLQKFKPFWSVSETKLIEVMSLVHKSHIDTIYDIIIVPNIRCHVINRHI